jgi:hypothetical protein
MRITLTLNDDVAKRLQAESRRTGQPLNVIVNEVLRASLAQHRATQAPPPFQVEPVHLGVPIPGHTYDRIGVLLEENRWRGAQVKAELAAFHAATSTYSTRLDGGGMGLPSARRPSR